MDRKTILYKAKENVDLIAGHLFSQGIRENNRFFIGNVAGKKGRSLAIELTGDKKGLWHDFATNDGGDIISLWSEARNLNLKSEFSTVLKEISDFIGLKDLSLNKTQQSWIYYDKDNKPLVRVQRYDNGGNKSFSPYDYKQNKFGFPSLRPLYNLPLIDKAEKVIFVEGEKCAEAITKQGYCGSTAMGGANTKIDKTDWSPLVGKKVLIWPDNDKAGINYANKVYSHLKSLNIDVIILELPKDKSNKWDCADAVEDGFDINNFIESECAMADTIEPKELIIKDWNINQYKGNIKETDFLVQDSFPLGVVSMLAAVGDTGKSMILLDLALKIATGQKGKCFGNTVKEKGTVVIFTAEDEKNEIQRRLNKLDPKDYRFLYPDKLIIIPLQNVLGAFPIIVENRGELYESEQFKKIKEQLLEIEDLKLIVFDPLSSFVHGDITFSSSASAYLMNSLSLLATKSKASVIITHHLRKTNGDIEGVDEIRDSIRGSSALVNGVRYAYAFWPLKMSKQREFFKSKEDSFIANSLYNGAVVKANTKVDREINTYFRNQSNGLLEVVGKKNNTAFNIEGKEELLLNEISRLINEGVEIKFSGKNGIYEIRDNFCDELKNISRRNVRAVVSSLMEKDKLRKNSDGAFYINEVSDGFLFEGINNDC
ncbi:MAG: AAA family ATPase [Alphaproteobacteria bacterium]|jgi:5S rRNA maturation endonuclease (ribonuclease M5)|nr:AAA family ATPase [Alphaproteobacteria bacterium]